MVFSRTKKKNQDNYHKQWIEEPYVSMTLRPGLKWPDLVKAPYGVDQNEWLATHTRPFFVNLSLIMASLSIEFCTIQNCPTMCAGPKTEYNWIDEKGKKVKGLSVPQYIDYLETYINRQLDDESVFPTKHDNPFPKDFLLICKKIYKLMFQVFAHIYHSHFSDVDKLKQVPHLNMVFTHFIHFTNAFNLIDVKDYAPLSEFRAILLNQT